MEYEGAHEPMTCRRSWGKSVGIDAEELTERYPRLFHVAAAGSWPSIERHGLLSTSALLDLFGVSGEQRVPLESRHRPESVPIYHRGLGQAVLRDQTPMNDKALRKCLCNDLKPCDWYRILNSKVFFWVTQERLEKMLDAYRATPQIVLTVETEGLVASHIGRITLSHINSGATRHHPKWRGPVPRGRDTFLPLDRYPFRKRRRTIAELAITRWVPDIRKHVLLVEERQAGAAPKSIWRRLSGAVSLCASHS